MATSIPSGLKISAIGALLAGSGNLAFNILLTPRYGITGAAVSLLFGYLFGLAWYIYRRPARPSVV